jgi:sugar phosphate isomerase/epimerase
MKIGISSWTYGWAVGVPGYPSSAAALDAFQLLERARSLGVAVVQIADNLPASRLSAADIARLGAEAARLGLTLELGTRGIDAGELGQYLGLARCLNASLVRTLLPAEISTADAVSMLCRTLGEYERANVMLALENYEGHATAELAQLVAAIDSPHLGICLDTVNSVGALELPVEVLARLGPHAVNIHVKDFDIVRLPSKLGYVIEGRPAGQGRLDVPRLLDVIRQHGRDPNMIIEQWTPWQGTLEETIALEAQWAEQSARYLRSALAPPLRVAEAGSQA